MKKEEAHIFSSLIKTLMK